jgi:hypothetical protein
MLLDTLPLLFRSQSRKDVRGGTVNDGGHISFSSGPHVCYQVSIPALWSCQEGCGAGDEHTQDRANDRTLPTSDGHPRPCVHVCIIHASSRAVLDVIAISSTAPRQTHEAM